MHWYKDDTRHGGGRFKCMTGEHWSSYVDNTIYAGTKTPLNATYRLIFDAFANRKSVTKGANETGVCW